MYICPSCSEEFVSEAAIQKHFAKCWRDKHPGLQSKPVPHSINEIKNVNDDIMDFFNSLQK